MAQVAQTRMSFLTELHLRKRVSSGWYYQINYTWSKAFTNAEQAQAEFAPYLDNTIGDVLEKKRTKFGNPASVAETTGITAVPRCTWKPSLFP
jgi:hypothetical protein